MEILGHLVIFFFAGFQNVLVRSQGGKNSGFSAILLIALAIGGVVFLGWWALLTLFIGAILGPLFARSMQ